MAREKISELKYKGNGSPFNDYVEAHGGVDAFSNASDAESLRQYQASQAREDSDEELQLEAIVETFNQGGLTEMSPMQQKVFQLCVIEGVTQELAAAQLKIAQQTVGEYMSQACKKLEALAEKRVKRPVLENTKWTKEMIREVAQKFTKKS